MIDNSVTGQSPLSVHFIDVGQGDCILIKTKYASALVDAGENGKGEIVVRYLQNQNIEKLDYVFITHPDSDHIGGMPDILEKFKVSNFVMPTLKKEDIPTTYIFGKLLDTLKYTGTNIETVASQEVFSLGDASITVLGPITSSSATNNMSIVLRVVIGDNSFLLTGDAEIEEEMDIIKSGCLVQSNVLKAGHHGSKNSSGEDFLRVVCPQTIIISCGRDNTYGHPNTQALQRFSQIGADVLRTDRLGSIVIGSDGKKISIDYKKK